MSILADTEPQQRDDLWTLLSGLPWLPLVDVQIAVLALEHGARLWSRDAHFTQIAGLEPTLSRFEPVRGAGR